MALHVAASARSIPALLQLGFGARIQCVSTGRYLGVGPRGTCTSCDRDTAQVWYVVSRDSFIGDNALTPRAAVVAVESPGGTPRYLSLNGASPKLLDEPAALRLRLPEPASVEPNDVSFALRQVMQERKFLAVRDGAKIGDEVCMSNGLENSTQFRFLVLVGSIGRKLGSGLSSDAKIVSVCEAVLLGLFELGVRFRLRSVHGRVLRVAARAAEAPGERLVAVVQDGPKTREDEVYDEELVLEAVRRSTDAGNVGYSRYVFTDVISGNCLSVRSSNIGLGRNQLLTETAALLIKTPQNSSRDNELGGFLEVTPVQNQWSRVHVGETVLEGSEARVQWLMAGMRGRLECRHHRGAWETFRVEYIQQTLDASLGELPPSNVYADADAADRALVRAELTAQVSAARGGPILDSGRKSMKSNALGFNHAAALQGLGSTRDEAGERGTQNSLDRAVVSSSSSALPATKATESTSHVNSSSGSAGAVSAAVAASGLPRNAASRSAKRKAKKKKNKNSGSGSATAAPSRAASNVAAGGGSGGGESRTNSDAKNDGTTGVPSSDANGSSSTTESASEGATSSGGPPCAACGRSVIGTYTKALGKNFHPQCFCCRLCRRPMLPGHGQFRERGGVPYCNACFAANIAPKCARCAKPIVETVTTAMEKTWHKECLTCVICRLPLTQQFWLYADKPNEPRCSRCVTGSEEAMPGVRYGSTGTRAVNLPGTMFNRGLSKPLSASGTGASPSLPSAGASSGGRARITTPITPAARR